MKNHIQLMAVFTVFLIIVPCIALFNNKSVQTETSAMAQDDTVKILFTDKNKVETLSMEDYMIGAVLAQMPADFEEETLKAQAVLAHTYALRRRLNEKASPTKNLQGADMSDDTSLYLSYFTESDAKELYKSDYKTAYEKISKAVKSVEKDVLTYNGEPIIVAFHAISSGTTESAENAWGEKIPYLISCDSSWDAEISGCEKTTEFTADELSARLTSAYNDISFDSLSENDWISVSEATTAGTVISIKLGNDFFITGQQLAEALSLPSPCISIEYDDDKFIFTTKGYGHLVGMSQYGANYLAKEGKKYDEILKHYFPETEISSKLQK